MPEPREPSSAKRLRWRGRCIQTLKGPNRQQRRALAKAAVAKFKDELILAGYSPKEMERKLAKWDGNPKTDPLEALINPKREEGTLGITAEAKAAGFSTEVTDALAEVAEEMALEPLCRKLAEYRKVSDTRSAEITEAGRKDWRHRFDEVKP